MVNPPRLLARLAGTTALVVTAFAVPAAGPLTLRVPAIRHAKIDLTVGDATASSRHVAMTAGRMPSPGRGDVVSPDVIEAPHRFDMVGVTVARKGPVPDAVEIRTSGDGRTWSAWQRLEMTADEGPDRSSGEYAARVASEPLWAPASTHVQARFEGARPGSPKLHVIDPGPDPEAFRPRAAAAMTAEPQIVTRAQWGADESIRRVARHEMASRVRVAYVHHTASASSYGEQDAARIVRSIYGYHVNSNGWDDIGYNFLVDRFGRIYEGRHGGIDKAVVGAHTAGFNTGSTGVAVIGTFDAAAPDRPAVDALTSLLAWKLDVHNVDPTKAVPIRSRGSNRYPEGQMVDVHPISGHRDVVHTDCPGDRLYGLLAGLRTEVASTGRPKIYNPAPHHPVAFGPNNDGHADTVTVRATLDGGQTWTAELSDPHGNLIKKETGTGGGVALTWDGLVNGARGGHGVSSVKVTGSDASGNIAREARIPVLLAAWPEGSVVRATDSGTVYRVQGGILRPYGSPSEFLNQYAWKEVASVTPSIRDAYRIGGRPGYREGTLLRTPGGAVWIVTGGMRRSFNSADDFTRLGYRWDAITDVSADEASVHQPGAPVDPAGLRHPDGTLVRGSGAAVYWLRDGQKRPVPSAAVFSTWFRWNEVVGISDTELASYPDGVQLTFRDGTLTRTTGDDAVYVVDAGVRRPIPSVKTFDALGLRWDNVLAVSATEAATAPIGPSV